MTTPTSSTEPRTRLAGRDFLYALRSPKTWLIPIVFCLLSGIGSSLLFWLPLQTMDTEAKAEIVQNFTYLLSASSLDATFFFPSVYDAYGVFLFFGMLAAFAAFDFCFSKTKSSAFLSFALRRETLYVNRLAAGGIWFVVGILLIQICTLITQYAFGFPITADLIVMLSFTFLLLFLESLLGLMIGGLAVAVCHNVPEGIFTAVCTAAAPYALVRLFGTAAELLLHGYGAFSYSYAFGNPPDLTDWGRLLNPLACLSNLPFQNADGTYSTTGIGDFSALASGERIELPGLFPAALAVLAVYSVVLCAAGILMFRKKKFENINAHQPGARSLGICLFTLGVLLCSTLPGAFSAGGWSGSAIGALLCAAVILVLLILLCTGKRWKALAASVLVLLGTVGLCFAGFAIYNTQYQNLIPAADEIEYAYMTESGDTFLSKSDDTSSAPMTSLFLGKDYMNLPEDPLLGRFTSEKDLETVRTLHRALADNSTDGDGSASVYYKLKNGKTVMRTYTGLGKETMEQLDALYDTDAACAQMIYLLTADSSEEIQKFNKKYDADFDKISSGMMNGTMLFDFDQTAETQSCTSPDMLEDYMLIFTLLQTQDGSAMWSGDFTDVSELLQSPASGSSELFSANLKHSVVLTGEDVQTLKAAAAADIKANGHSYILRTQEKPAAILSLGTSTTEYNLVAATVPSETFSFGIYPSMKNTIAAIRGLGYGDILEADDEVVKIYAVDIASIPAEWRELLSGTSRRFTGSYSTLYDKAALQSQSESTADTAEVPADADTNFVALDAQFDLSAVLAQQQQQQFTQITGRQQIDSLMEHANILADSNGDSIVLLAVYSDYTMTAYNLDESDRSLLPGEKGAE